MTDLKIAIQYYMACVGDMLPWNWICEACKASAPTWHEREDNDDIILPYLDMYLIM